MIRHFTTASNLSIGKSISKQLSFSTSTKSIPSNKKELPATLQEQMQLKLQLKQRRTELYQAKLQRRARLPTRRDPKIKNYNKVQFQSWYQPFVQQQNYLSRQAKREQKLWNIQVAALIERLPVVTPDVEDWEEKFENLQAELDRYRTKVYPKELNLGDPMDDEVLTREQLFALLPEGFTPAPRETEADHKGIIQTLDRKLKTRIYLTIKPNDEKGWMIPTVPLLTSLSSNKSTNNIPNGETFVEAARRAAKTFAGNDVMIRCLSYCPMAVQMVPYTTEKDKNSNPGYFGTKTFYMRVQYEYGDLDEKNLKKQNNDWGWLDRGEIVERVQKDKGDEISKFFHYLL